MNPKGFILFDIDGVIRDVSESYRLAVKHTVDHFCNHKVDMEEIDILKSEGIWNNDWKVSYELIKRKGTKILPEFDEVVEIFNNFYFGNNLNRKSEKWDGFIKNEQLLVEKRFFDEILENKFLYGFVSGAELVSAKFVLEERLKLDRPQIIAMEDAPEKPDPSGLIEIAEKLAGKKLGSKVAPIFYLGDTVADVLTIKNAKKRIPSQKFISIGICPPHLELVGQEKNKLKYESNLINAGAEILLSSSSNLLKSIKNYI